MSGSNPYLSAIVGLLLLCGAGGVGAVPILPGQALDFRFTIPGTPTAPGGPVDVLNLILNATCGPVCSEPHAHFELFDGPSLLGELDLIFAQPFTTFAFTSTSSLFEFRSSRVADFSSISDGSIDGRILITNTSTTLFDFLVSRTFGASLGHGGGTNSYNNASLEPVFGTQGPAGTVPEPTSISLALLALLAGRGRGRRRVARPCAMPRP